MRRDKRRQSIESRKFRRDIVRRFGPPAPMPPRWRMRLFRANDLCWKHDRPSISDEEWDAIIEDACKKYEGKYGHSTFAS